MLPLASYCAEPVSKFMSFAVNHHIYVLVKLCVLQSGVYSTQAVLQQAGLTNPALLPTILQGLQQSSGSGSANSDAMHLAAAVMSAQAQSVGFVVGVGVVSCVTVTCVFGSPSLERFVELHSTLSCIQPISFGSR